MKLTADYHTHTKFSDAHTTVDENVKRAKELGLQEIAITDHGYEIYHFGVRRRKKDKYFEAIKTAAEKYDMKVLIGMEGNIMGREGTCDLKKEDYADFDLYLCGIHPFCHHESFHDFMNAAKGYLKYHYNGKPSGRLIEETTKSYINTIKKNPVDVITHINFQCYANAVEIAKCCRDYGTYVEISGKKTHFSDDELCDVVNTGVRFVVNSDAHKVDKIGDIAIAEEQILRVGVPLERIDNIDGRFPTFRLAELKKHM